ESLPIDITNLKVNHSIRVGDLKYDKIELIDPRIATVLSVATSRVVSKEEGEAEAEHTAGEAAEAAAPADEAK
ncbi:MAG TPA: hypothetical protein PKY14_08430, partial [Bacteroidales bacterium]|nr:hypothetical protein [Bacteroidales bacterium]